MFPGQIDIVNNCFYAYMVGLVRIFQVWHTEGVRGFFRGVPRSLALRVPAKLTETRQTSNDF